jgi:hypothetical protein
MRENIVRFEYIKEKPTGVYLPKKDTFKAGKSKKHEWLQRLCFMVLAKLGAYDTYAELRVETITIDKRSFVDRLLAQQHALIRDFGINNRNRFTLLIGARDYQELMGSPEISQMITFDTDFMVDKNGREAVMGMDVTIVPWMTGVVVLPRER